MGTMDNGWSTIRPSFCVLEDCESFNKNLGKCKHDKVPLENGYCLWEDTPSKRELIEDLNKIVEKCPKDMESCCGWFKITNTYQLCGGCNYVKEGGGMKQ